jgi:ribosome assembly protein RRB1
VFASCSVDGTLQIWDTRHHEQSAISIKAHEADVNVISWNRLASCMIASGCDDGTFCIWDLRSLKVCLLPEHLFLLVLISMGEFTCTTEAVLQKVV